MNKKNMPSNSKNSTSIRHSHENRNLTETRKHKGNQNKVTFKDFDKLKLKSFAESLLQNMKKGTASNIGEQGAWTISLNAEFGNGKTTFLEMFKYFIEEEHKKEYNVISINAWESDFYGQPIIAILSELSNYMKKNKNWKDQAKDLITKAGKISINNIEQVTSLIVQTTIQLKTGVSLDISKLLEQVKKSMGEEIFKNINQRKSAIEEIKNTVSEYTKEKKLIIIVDELDRARPDYAVHFLEDIKHFFDIKNVIFLVAVNRKQMSATVKCLYGQELDFEGYYRKFFKQEIDLPDPYKEAQNLIDNSIQKTKVKYLDNTDRSYRIKSYYLSCKLFELTLREVETGIRIFENILGSEVNNTTWTYLDCYPFFICLYIKNKQTFKQMLDENFSINDFLHFLDNKTMHEKDFRQKYQPESDTEKRQEKYNINYLLGEISCSFIKNDNEILKYKEQIKKRFPEIASIEKFFTYNDPHLNDWKEGFTLKNGQPALEMCQNIYQHKSVFKK